MASYSTPPATRIAHRLPAGVSNSLLSWRVSNFKAFGRELQEIQLAPITLIFGPNSAGKSSALHSLLFMQEAVPTGELDVHEPGLAEGAVDLGGFSQFTYCQRPDENPITLEFTLKPDLLNSLFSRVLGEQTKIRAERVTVGLVLSMIPTHAEGDPSAGKPALLRLDVALDGHVFCRTGRNGVGALTFRTIDLDHPFFIGVRDSYAELLRPQSANPSLAQTRANAVIRDVFPRTSLEFVDLEETYLLPDGAGLGPPEKEAGPPEPESEPLTDPAGLTDAEHRLDFEEEKITEQASRADKSRPEFSPDDLDYQIISILMPQFSTLLGEIVRNACFPLRAALESLTYLGPLRSFPARDFTLTHSRDSHWHAGGGFAWDVLAREEIVRAKVNAWFSSDFLQTPYQFVVTDLVSGEIITSAIESEFSDIVHEKWREHEAKRGLSNPDDGEAFYFPYDAWDTDVLGKRLSSAALERAHPSRRTELRLIDKRTGARVSHRDVGVGLSQILPILVGAFSAQGGLHMIEQPEIHVHPALQAELGDMFIASALGESRCRYLIETHSEHLILRLLRRIRQTSANELPKGMIPVRPEDVSVIYAEPTKEGTKLRHLRITPDGDFADRWPNGFFTERGKELFD